MPREISLFPICWMRASNRILFATKRCNNNEKKRRKTTQKNKNWIFLLLDIAYTPIRMELVHSHRKKTKQ